MLNRKRTKVLILLDKTHYFFYSKNILLKVLSNCAANVLLNFPFFRHIGTQQKKNVMIRDGPLAQNEVLCAARPFKNTVLAPNRWYYDTATAGLTWAFKTKRKHARFWEEGGCQRCNKALACFHGCIVMPPTFDWLHSYPLYSFAVTIRHSGCSCVAAKVIVFSWELPCPSQSAGLNVSPSLKLSFPLLFPFALIVTRWFYRAACCWKTKFRRSVSKEECFCAACKRLSLQVSTWNTKVFSYLICIHSHNEWASLSCFQVRRVQTRLLFALSSNTCMLLPPVQTLESSHELCPG